MKDFYTTRDIAEMTGLQENTIRKFINLGKIKTTKIGNNHIISPDDLRDFLLTHKPRKKLTTLVNEVVNDDSLSVEEKSEKIEQLLRNQEKRRGNV